MKSLQSQSKTIRRSVTFPAEADAMRAQGGSEEIIACYSLPRPQTVSLPFFTEFTNPAHFNEVMIDKFIRGDFPVDRLPESILKEAILRKRRSDDCKAVRKSLNQTNADGTTTCENYTLRVTLPTSEFDRIGRYGVFHRAMRMLGNRCEAEILGVEPVDPADIMRVARESLIFEYLSGNCRYDLGETLMRMNGGHRMSPGMAEDTSRARAYADGVLSPITPDQLRDWACELFIANPQMRDAEFSRKLAVEKLRIGAEGPEAAGVLTAAAEMLERERQSEIERRRAIGNTCPGWKIEIIGVMPEQIGLCRYQ